MTSAFHFFFFNFQRTSEEVNTFSNMQMAGVLFLLCWHFHFQNIMQKKPVAYSKHVHLVSKISRLSNADKGKSLLIGVFSRDLFSFTSGVTEHFSTVPVKGRE